MILLSKTVIQLKIKGKASELSAQCSPRHACTLEGPLLMQVHEWPQAAPELALAEEAGV